MITISPEDITEEVNEPITLDFNDDSFFEEIEKPTNVEIRGNETIEDDKVTYLEEDGDENDHEEEIDTTAEDLKGFTTEEFKEKIDKEMADAAKEMSPEEMQLVAEILVEIIDAGISLGLMFLAKDTKDTAYSLSKERKNKLTKLLTRYLVRQVIKVNILTLFIITLIIAYAVPVRNAIANRKAITKKEKEIKAEKEKEAKFTQEAKEVKVEPKKTTKVDLGVDPQDVKDLKEDLKIKPEPEVEEDKNGKPQIKRVPGRPKKNK